MLGIKDPWIIAAFLMIFFSVAACIVYGLINWNKGAENEVLEIKEETNWEEEDTKTDKK